MIEIDRKPVKTTHAYEIEITKQKFIDKGYELGEFCIDNNGDIWMVKAITAIMKKSYIKITLIKTNEFKKTLAYHGYMLHKAIENFIVNLTP